MLIEVLFALLICYTVWWYAFRNPKNIPPGPIGLPFIGYLPFLTLNPGKQFMELEKKYGPIMSFDRGPAFSIIINGYDLIKKAMQEEAYTGLTAGMGEAFLQGGNSFGFDDGSKWHEGRRFALSTLRDFGMGKSSLEPKILDELNYLLAAIRKSKGKVFNLEELVTSSIGNINTLMQFNQRFDYNDPEQIALHKTTNEAFRGSRLLFSLIPMFPTLVKFGLHKYLPAYKLQAECVKGQEIFIKRIIEDHKKNYYPGKKDDYVDAFLTEREERLKKNDHPEYFDDVTLMTDIRLISLAANETTSMTMSWVFVYLVCHPDVQRKLQTEIDTIIGRQRQPSMSDKANMPYTEAFLQEIYRRALIAPTSNVKRVKEDTNLEGYFIPKDSQVFINMWSVHFDEKLWDDPESFRPERFLNEKGEFIKTDKLIPFSTGRRKCIGENLARMVIFLHLTSILQNFSICAPDGESFSVEPEIGFGFFPKPYKVSIVERENN